MASFGQDRAGGQNHDRLDGAMANVAPAPRDDVSGEPVGITPVQKMLSATSGSLLTALLSTTRVPPALLAAVRRVVADRLHSDAS